MSFLSDIEWSWPAFVLAFSLGFMLAIALLRWFQGRFGEAKMSTVNQDYFKGLNFVLNEEPDKAIEVFIKALEVDSETVELHLALGGLFRRKGQVDRATRIHQNLIIRPNLSEDQRLQAIYELAQDYYKAGLLDRAENLFLELKEAKAYRRLAIDGLSNIYSQEKEWHSAIDALRSHRRRDRADYQKQLAHFWCELAYAAIDSQEFEQADQHLRNALAENSAAVRPVLLQGELAYQQGDYKNAIDLWREMVDRKASLAELVVGKMILSYQALGDQAGLTDYVLNQAAIPKSDKAFHLWQATLTNLLGYDAAIKHIFEQVHHTGVSGPVAGFLYQSVGDQQLSSEHQYLLLKEFLGREKNRKIEYTCGACGFATRAMYWHCQNCGEWESFS